MSGRIGDENFTVGDLLYRTPRLDGLTPYPVSLAEKFYANPLPGSDRDYFNYLYLTNMSETPFQYCLSISTSEYGFISDNSIVTAISNYGNTTL